MLKRISIILILVLGILMIPLVTMQFSNNVKWDLTDFLVAGGILTASAFMIDLILRKINAKTLKYSLLIILIVLVLLFWMELAVGIFNSPLSGN